MKAKQLPSGNFRVQVVAGYDDNGKRIVKSFTAEKEWEALKMASDFLERNDDSLSQDITLRNAIEKYIDSRRNLLEESTILSYERMSKNRFQSIMDIKLKDLNTLIIQQAINNETKKVSAGTVRTAFILLESTLNMYEVSINRKKIKLPKVLKVEKQIPSFETIFRIVKGTSIELPVLLACWLSLRIGEVIGLQFKDVDFKSKIIHVRRTIIDTKNGSKVREGCKTEKSKRDLKAPEYILNLISNIPYENDDEFIIHFTRFTLHAKFKSILRKNGIEITFHDLRHLNASIMLMLGIPDKYAMERGGWSNSNILKSVYQQTFKEEKDKVSYIIDDYFNNIVKK